MTYIVKDECIKCKLTDCVEVCPVDCIPLDLSNPETQDQLMEKYIRLTAVA